MTPSKFFPPHASFESFRKQAKKLVRLFVAGDPDVLTRVHAQLPAPELPLTLRDAQLVLAREYGFAGWKDLRAAALQRDGKGLDWAAAEAERAIHANNIEQLAQLVRDYPALLTWRSDLDESLLGFATGSYGDSGDPERERTFTRLECAEFLLEAGADAPPSIWDGPIQARAKGILALLSRRRVPPRTLDVLTALDDAEGVRDLLPTSDSAAVAQAFQLACRFGHSAVAALLLERCIQLDPTLGQRIERWRGRTAFIGRLAEHADTYGNGWQPARTPWYTLVMNELLTAVDKDNLPEFNRWLEREPGVLGDSHLVHQVELVEHAVLQDRAAFIARLLESAPALKAKRPPTAAIRFALEYGKAHLIPLLTSVWPLPDDLPHGAGAGDFERVKAWCKPSWLDEAGRPKLNLADHYPTNSPDALRARRWTRSPQHILDIALAWACVNRHFEIASFLLKHGANINTDWATHEPASILHECAVHGNYEAVQFLIDHGIDMTICDYRWNATAEGWARHAAKDKRMAELLARGESARKAQAL